MRKKLDTRFPASRIKKIMQADEDVGKIALAVPLLVSKALEQFLQDLCDRTYDITLRRGAKTISSLHLKQCVQSFNVFDFLKEIVSKVPDLGGSDAAGEDRVVGRRRKAAEDEDNDSEEETKRSKTTHDTGHSSSSGRGRGRGRGRPRGRGTRTVERESAQLEKCEDDPDMSPQHDNKNPKTERLDNGAESKESIDNTTVGSSTNAVIRNFDLNLDLDENGTTEAIRLAAASAAASAAAASAASAAALAAAAAPPPTTTAAETTAPASSAEPPNVKHEEYPGWSISDIKKMAIDPIQLAQLNRRLDEEDEDYDEEG